MESIELTIDTSDAVPLPGPLRTAASVFLPDPAKLTAPPLAIFAFPGGGYSKGYFDLHPPGHRGYSQAEHHLGARDFFVLADHLGVGASSIPDLPALHATRFAQERLQREESQRCTHTDLYFLFEQELPDAAQTSCRSAP